MRSTATFAWLPVAGLSYQCSLDNGAYVACTSPVTYTKLKGGIHTFRVHSTNSIGDSSLDAFDSWRVT